MSEEDLAGVRARRTPEQVGRKRIDHRVGAVRVDVTQQRSDVHPRVRHLPAGQGQGEVEPRDQGARAHPVGRVLGETGRRPPRVERLAHVDQVEHDRLAWQPAEPIPAPPERRAGLEGPQRRTPAKGGHFHKAGVRRPQGRDRELEGRLGFPAEVLPREKLRRKEQGLVGRAQISLGPGKRLRHPPHQRGRRHVGDEALAKLGRDARRGGRMRRQQVEDLFAVLHTAAAREFGAEDLFGANVVPLAAKHEVPRARIDRPAGQRPRHLLHILLGVAAVHAQGVQFQQLAAVVLV